MVVPNQPVACTPPGSLALRRPSAGDGPALWELARACGLDLNSPYAYAMWGEYFADTSVVALDADDVVGFISGFRVPADPDTIFVWQVGVSTRQRRRGVGGQMLDWLVEASDARRVEATVTLSNAASISLFRSLGARHGTVVDVQLLFGSDVLPEGHEPEFRFRVPVGDQPNGRQRQD